MPFNKQSCQGSAVARAQFHFLAQCFRSPYSARSGTTGPASASRSAARPGEQFGTAKLVLLDMVYRTCPALSVLGSMATAAKCATTAVSFVTANQVQRATQTTDHELFDAQQSLCSCVRLTLYCNSPSHAYRLQGCCCLLLHHVVVALQAAAGWHEHPRLTRDPAGHHHSHHAGGAGRRLGTGSWPPRRLLQYSRHLCRRGRRCGWQLFTLPALALWCAHCRSSRRHSLACCRACLTTL